MDVKCSHCPAVMELGTDGRDIGDSAYKRVCPILREHPAQGLRDLDLDCPYMRSARDMTLRTYAPKP